MGEARRGIFGGGSRRNEKGVAGISGRLETLKDLLVALVIFVGGNAVVFAIWAVATRPSWWQLKNEIYSGLCGMGLVLAWGAFIVLFRPDWFWGVGSFLVVCWLTFKASEKFQ
jgi:hypothetical protein